MKNSNIFICFMTRMSCLFKNMGLHITIAILLVFLTICCCSPAPQQPLNTNSTSTANSTRNARNSPPVDFEWSKNQHDVPTFISELNNQPGFNRLSSLIDRAIVRAPWNVLMAKLVKLVTVFFVESYLVQLFGVDTPIYIN